MDWPVSSPDLNSIEHLWIRLNVVNTTTMADLWLMLFNEWDAIIHQCLTMILSNMRRTCLMLAAVYGSSTWCSGPCFNWINCEIFNISCFFRLQLFKKQHNSRGTIKGKINGLFISTDLVPRSFDKKQTKLSLPFVLINRFVLNFCWTI